MLIKEAAITEHDHGSLVCISSSRRKMPLMVLANYEKSLGFLGCVELVNKQLAVHEKLMSEQYFCNNRCDAVKMH